MNFRIHQRLVGGGRTCFHVHQICVGDIGRRRKNTNLGESFAGDSPIYVGVVNFKKHVLFDRYMWVLNVGCRVLSIECSAMSVEC